MLQNTALHTGDIVKGNKFTYTIQAVLGQGSFGITYLASTNTVLSGPLGDIETEVKVAIKEFFMKEFSSRREDGTITEMTDGSLVQNYSRKFRKEAENLAKLSHPGIVKVLEVFDANNTCYYAMQYIAGGSLDAYVKSRGGLPEEEAVECIRQIGDAVQYMHDHKMLHLDLKPGNVMRSEDGKKMFLIDFGLSKQYTSNGEPESSTTIGLGTPGYAPLEQSNADRDRDFAPTLDVYALGSTFYKLLTGETPPKASDVLNEGLPIEKLQKKGVSQIRINAIEKAMEPRKGMRAKSIKDFLTLLSNNEKDSEDTIVDDIILNDSKSEENSTTSAKEKSDSSEPKPAKKPFRFSKWIIWMCAGIVAIIFAVTIPILFPKVSKVSFDSEPQGAEVWLDGKDSGKLTPCTLGSIPFGPHYITFKLDGYREYTDSIMVLDRTPICYIGKLEDYEWIDLELSVKWATCNVGASRPEDYGYYFAWGETSPKSSYDWENLKYRTSGDSYDNVKFSKYVTESKYGSVDNKTRLDLSDDAARANWGGSWRMPTDAEFQELIDKCTWTWTTQGSYSGYKVTSKSNGSSIFLPAAGYRDGSSLDSAGSLGNYWSSSLYGSSAYVLAFISDGVGHFGFDRFLGQSVRPVCP